MSQNVNEEFKSKLKDLKNYIDKELSNVLDRKFPTPLYKPIEYALSTGGKRLRPIIVLLSCESISRNYKNAIYGAIAVEIMHNFTLVHDDIMDNDYLRRGKPTVFRKYNLNTAILTGDGLMSLSYKVLSAIEHKRLPEIFALFSDTILTICEGQAMDEEFELKDKVLVTEYIDMSYRKTAVLFSTCCQIGGIIGNADDDTLFALREFGKEIGLAFQIQDDLLDIVSDESLIGKDLGSDIKKGKKSYPLILLENKMNKKEKKFYQNLKNKKNIKNEDIARIIKIMNTYNIIEITRKEVSTRIQNAQNILLNHSFPPDDNLIKISQFILERNH